MLVRVTGGISRVVGALYPVAAAEACVCGTRPVRTIGGCRRVDMALLLASRTVLPRRLLLMSRLPPIDPMDARLALLPLSGWYLLLEEFGREVSWFGK